MSTTYSQIQKVTASDPSAGDSFGQAVALSMFGDVALIGRPNFSTSAGAVSVFRYSHSDAKWIDQFELAASDQNDDDMFGFSVSLASHGLVAAIGAIGGFSGSAYIFVNSDTSWVQRQQLLPSDGQSNEEFGYSIATSAGGDTVIVGSWHAAINSNNQQGAAYIFQFNGASWAFQKKIYASDGSANDNFGTAVALSADGQTALVGAAQSNTVSGLAYIFICSDSIWHQQKTIQNPNPGGICFGTSVALFGQGPTQIALVGSNWDTINGSEQGSAYVFIRSDGTWPVQQRLWDPNGAAYDQFGSSVALGRSTEGHDIALIGAAGGNKAYVFKRASDVWTLFQKIVANNSDSSVNFGNTVALTGDGSKGLIGASAFNFDQGSTYFFGASPSNTPAPGTNNKLISFLPDILIATIVLYGGIVGMFLFNASEE